MKPGPTKPPGWSRRRWLQAWPVAALAGQPAARATMPATDARIPWPPLLTVDGRPLAQVLAPGVPVVVVFWATWCAYCERHNARIERLHRTLDPSRLRVLGVAQDRDAAAVQRYLQRHQHGFPVVLDDGPLRARFTTRRVVPMTFVVAADGRVLQAIPGEMAEDDVMGLARLALPAAR